MKLTELASTRPIKQVSKVFESFFNQKLTLSNLSRRDTKVMLNRVTGLIKEHRSSHRFYQSEKNPAY
jgi:hypothetical protein